MKFTIKVTAIDLSDPIYMRMPKGLREWLYRATFEEQPAELDTYVGRSPAEALGHLMFALSCTDDLAGVTLDITLEEQ